jgi:putative ABC transport system substrate-binding protein
MKRREFITLLGGAAVAWPIAASAQQPTMPVIGVLDVELPELRILPDRARAFGRGLSEAGFVEGQNIATEYWWADGRSDQLPALAAELVHRQVAVIVATGVAAALAAKSATQTIPIVFFTGVNPVAFGIVASLNRPGGNLTGVTSLFDEVAPKRLELMHELVPTATTMALLVNPSNPNAEAQSRDMQAAGRTLGLQLHVLHASTDRDLDALFAAAAQLRADALVIGPDPYLNSRIEQLSALTVRHAIPTIFFTREFAAAGGLMSYGADGADSYHTVGLYTGRILKGEKPADLPVQQATKVELVINLKTAKALGLTVPPSLLARADEIIE